MFSRDIQLYKKYCCQRKAGRDEVLHRGRGTFLWRSHPSCMPRAKSINICQLSPTGLRWGSHLKFRGSGNLPADYFALACTSTGQEEMVLCHPHQRHEMLLTVHLCSPSFTFFAPSSSPSLGCRCGVAVKRSFFTYAVRNSGTRKRPLQQVSSTKLVYFVFFSPLPPAILNTRHDRIASAGFIVRVCEASTARSLIIHSGIVR